MSYKTQCMKEYVTVVSEKDGAYIFFIYLNFYSIMYEQFHYAFALMTFNKMTLRQYCIVYHISIN